MNYDETSAAIKKAGYIEDDVINSLIPISFGTYFDSDFNLETVRDSLIESGIAPEDITAAILVRFKRQ